MPQYKFSLTYEAGINKEISSSIEYEMYLCITDIGCILRNHLLLEKHSLGTYLPRITNHDMSLLDFKKIETIKSLLIMDNLIFVILKMFKFISKITYIRYPNNRLNISLAENKCTQLYQMFKNFKYSYYGKERQPLIDYNDFINKYPVIVIDCSKQSEVIIKGSTINIKINFQW